MKELNLTAVVITAMLCIAGIESVALLLGHNGTILATVIGAFCLVLGATAEHIRGKKKTN